MASFIAPMKSPGSLLDYGIDWTELLEEGETVDSADWSISGATLAQNRIDGNVTVAWVDGGESGYKAKLTCKMTTSVGRIYERTILIPVRQR